jgi:hypothetical protein
VGGRYASGGTAPVLILAGERAPRRELFYEKLHSQSFCRLVAPECFTRTDQNLENHGGVLLVDSECLSEESQDHRALLKRVAYYLFCIDLCRYVQIYAKPGRRARHEQGASKPESPHQRIIAEAVIGLGLNLSNNHRSPECLRV